jgi:hypothetical protein
LQAWKNTRDLVLPCIHHAIVFDGSDPTCSRTHLDLGWSRGEDRKRYVLHHSSSSPSTSTSSLCTGGTCSFSDGSGALFNMYTKMSEEEDNKMVDRWQKDADGILIFVSCHFILTPLCSTQPENCRLVCSLPLSRHWSRCPSRILGQIHRIPQHSTSRTSISFLQTPTYLVHLSLLAQSDHRPSRLRRMRSGSTHFGSRAWPSVLHVHC